ncbi:MAG: hypothetical protein Kow0081_1420 [Candidatus Dojkabacteria bacterium]
MIDILERKKEFMNTLITFKVIRETESTVDLLNSIEEGFGEFDRIVKKFTRFNENSELSNLNRQGGNWVKVSGEFFFLIEKMLEVANKSNGAFDPTVVDYLEVYGYDKNYDFSRLDNPKKLNALVEKITKRRKSWKEIKLDKDNLRVKLAEGQKIDLGGIGKGYAIDLAFKHLSEVAKNFLIDAGGDIRVKGKNQNNEVWKIDLMTKDKKGKFRNIGVVELEDGRAIASSGSWARRVKQFHHLINPKTGKPVEKKYSTVYVEAENALTADAWATALFVNPKINIENLNIKVLFDE